MLALTNPHPSLALPAGTTLQPTIFLRNASANAFTAQLTFNWRSDATTGKANTAVPMQPYETRRVDVAALQAKGTIPASAQWAYVSITAPVQPDELLAVAASFDASGRHGAQTPFSDQVANHWEGGKWEVDANHDTIISVGNAGTKTSKAQITFYHTSGQGKYQVEKELAPDEQLWLDVGNLIGNQVPDKYGKTIPADVMWGTYELRSPTDKPTEGLFEGKLVVDKTYGYAVHGCGRCCGYDPPYMDINPLPLVVSGSGNQEVWALDSCTGFDDNVTGPFLSGGYGARWWTGNAQIATANWNLISGVAVGSTTNDASGYLLTSGPRECPNTRELPLGNTNVGPQFNVAYSSYIPVDHINGPSFCYYQGQSTDLLYMGDANRGTYRATEFIDIIVASQQSFGFFPATGQTRNYGADSPKNGSTLSSLDEDGVANDCYLWNNAGQAPTNAMLYDTSFPYATQGQVHFDGSASNPLESQKAAIQWDMRTVIDTTNPSAPTATVNYNHTCYPAHQIKVNGQVVYLYTPSRNDLTYVGGCLTGLLPEIVGQTTPVQVPTH
jgi:hypothetical protein